MTNSSDSFTGTTTFQVSGMTCEHCQRAVAAEVGAVDGISDVSVDLASGAVTVTATRPVGRGAIAAAVDEAGYTLVS